ncbi:membrane protein [Streptomyces violaceorubidus]
MAAGADVSWGTSGLDALGLMPGIGMFSKGIKVAGETADAARAAAQAKVGLLGRGFQYTDIGKSRILMSFGKASRYLSGGTRQGGPRENRRHVRLRL